MSTTFGYNASQAYGGTAPTPLFPEVVGGNTVLGNTNVPSGTRGAPNQPTVTSSLQSGAPLSSGYYVAVACLSGILFANTAAAPYLLGIIGLAFIYQFSLFLQKK